MSSYLLAFVISDLESISNEATKQPDETLHRIWVRPDSLAEARYALDNSFYVLKAMEDYIGFKFELPKVDSAGVPNKGGAMENWGTLCYILQILKASHNVEHVYFAVLLVVLKIFS